MRDLQFSWGIFFPFVIMDLLVVNLPNRGVNPVRIQNLDSVERCEAGLLSSVRVPSPPIAPIPDKLLSIAH